MSYNGSGTFLINTAGQPVVSGTVISSTAFNALTADLATGLSTAITKDGQTTITANIPMANYKFTGLGVGSAAGDSANLSQVQSTAVKLLASVSGADTITAVGSPNVAAYVAGQMFYFVAAGANTGAVTINIDSLGAKSITRDGTTALAAGDIQSGEVCVIVYDGTQFQLVNGASQSASIVTENLTVNKATVLNESGGDNDTRIEGDTDANLLFVDASTDRVGVGIDSPASKLHVNGGGGAITFGTNPTFNSEIKHDTSTNASTIYNNKDSSGHTFQSNGTNLMLVNGAGNLGLGVTPSAWTSGYSILQPQRASFGTIASTNRAYMSANWVDDGADKYIANGFASRYLQIDGAHRWATAGSGSAGGALSFTTAMTLDASGNLGVGTTSPGGRLEVSKSGPCVIYNKETSVNVTSKWVSTDGSLSLFGTESNHPQTFITNNNERARISAGGEVFINTTATMGSGSNKLEIFVSNAVNDSGILIKHQDATGATAVYAQKFLNSSGSEVGSIKVSSTATSFNQSSDRRMKENISSADDAGLIIDAIEIVKHDWKSGGHTRYGVVAQDLHAIAPEAVSEGDDGEEVERAWGVDYSKLVPMLVKEIQSLRARVAALEAK